MIRRLVVVVLLLVSSLASGSTVAAVEGTPTLDVALPDHIVSVGEETTLQFTLSNDADLETLSTTDPTLNERVTTARGVSITVKSGEAPVTVQTARQQIGSLPDGTVSNVAVDIAVDDDARPGTYDLPVVVRYTYEAEIDEDGSVDETTRTKRTTVPLTIEDEARFQVLGATTDLQPASTGVVTLTMENVGSEPAANARVVLTSTAASLTFDGAPSGSRYVGSWEPGEQRSVSYVVTASDAVRAQPYTFEVVTTFSDTSGDTVSTDPDAVGVTPLGRIPFGVDDVRSTLAVGDRGTVSGTVVNDGSESVDDAVVHITTTSRAITFVEETYPVGTLDAGERVSFEFTGDVSKVATAGPRLFDVAVSYETAGNNERTSDAYRFSADVAPEREYLAVEPVNATFDVDSSNRFTVRVTNTGDEPLTDVDAHLLAQAPLSSDAPESFVPRLEPGESALLNFELTVSEDAVVNTYAVALNVTADTDDRTVVSGPHSVPIVVTESESASSDLLVLGVGTLTVLAVLAGGWWWLRR
ncbi:COG1361 S-layer family protein [Halogranum rubrum]|uniref:Sialidase n=1 Tax=Halogranum salarium B-1 TaxID=1210908 RepID=J3JDZ0_9EURY|nr:COG1361 S-layer family protein [Halogranum salarium]EJN57906.1 hypothetical protein HSB1_33230 [Halogranum salarium B-1]